MDYSSSQAVSEFIPGDSGRVVLVCEHASNFVPEDLQQLGLDTAALQSHIAWDIGAKDLALGLSSTLDFPLVASDISRLVFDCNRSADAPDAVPAISETFAIPGNTGLSAEQIRHRAERCYLPFEQSVRGMFTRFPMASLVTIHSFTPVYHGEERRVDIGILHDSDTRLADQLLILAGQYTDLEVARNQPYGPEHGVAHTLNLHGNQANRPNVMIEVKNSLLADNQQRQQMTTMVSAWLSAALDQLSTH